MTRLKIECRPGFRAFFRTGVQKTSAVRDFGVIYGWDDFWELDTSKIIGYFYEYLVDFGAIIR